MPLGWAREDISLLSNLFYFASPMQKSNKCREKCFIKYGSWQIKLAPSKALQTSCTRHFNMFIHCIYLEAARLSLVIMYLHKCQLRDIIRYFRYEQIYLSFKNVKNALNAQHNFKPDCGERRNIRKCHKTKFLILL